MQAIYVDVDSLRPDFLQPYGYEAPSSPGLAAFAEDAICFDRAYAANSPCMASRAGFLSGRYGVNNGVVTHGSGGQRLRSPKNWNGLSPTAVDGNPISLDGVVLEADVRFNQAGDESYSSGRKWYTLPETLFHSDVETVAISSFPRHPAPWFYTLWDQFRHPREPTGSDEGYHTVRAETVIDHALEYLENAAPEDDFFLYIQLWDPHGPYKRTTSEVERFRGEIPEPDYPTAEQIDSHQAWDARMSAGDMGISKRRDLLEMLANYCAEIRYMDTHLSRLFEYLRDVDLYDESLVLFASDHGEEFGERGIYRDHGSTHEATQRVPLLIKPPKSQPLENSTTDELVTNIDLAPTILDYFDIDPPAEWQGHSLRSIIEDDYGEWRDLIVAEHGVHIIQRSVITHEWKFTKTLHPSVWDEYEDKLQLYDLPNDPYEQTNVASDHPDLVTNLEKEMAYWISQHRGHGEDPLRSLQRSGPPYYHLQKGDAERS
jgi:arylsulfatase A-like enzyme